jgi:hypothetical protein
MPRPAGAVPPWATDALYPAGANPWNATPTKVTPSAGKLAEGWEPSEKPPAQFQNYWQNLIFSFLEYLDGLDVLTWPEPGAQEGAIATGGNTAGDLAWAPWHPARWLYHANNEDIVRLSANGGYTWTADYTIGGGAVIQGMAQRKGSGATDGSTAAIYEVGGAGRVALTGIGDAWNNAAVTGSLNLRKVIGDDYLNVYWAGGQIAGPNPAIFRIADDNGGPTITIGTRHPPAVGNVLVDTLAAGPVYKIAGTLDTIYRWQDSDTASVAITYPDPGATEIADLLYLKADGQFMFLACNTGVADSRIYTSVDGATGTWVRRDVVGDVIRTSEIVHGSACVRGSIVACVVVRDGFRWLAYSRDLGANWSLVPNPLGQHFSLTPDPVLNRFRDVGQRFMAVGYQAAGTVYHAQSLRVR